MKTIYVTIQRMSSKRLSITAYALQKQREGYTVVIHDIGGQDVVLKPKIPREITKEEFTKTHLRYLYR